MKRRAIWIGAGLMAMGTAAFAQDVPADHVVLTEMIINCDNPEDLGGSSEFVEIYNPTSAAVDLTNYFLTDDNTYYNYPTIVNNGDPYDLGTSDFSLQFPPGTSIPSGGVIVVAYYATDFAEDFFSNDLSAFYALPGSPQLFESVDSDATVGNMITHSTAAPVDNPSTTYDESVLAKNNMSHTNGGEFVALFYWDGISDLVTDIDMVSYATPDATNWISQRDGWANEGPNGDGTFNAYILDHGIDTVNIDVDPTFDPNAIIRRTTIEVGEAGLTGNGLNSSDETAEWCWDTWYVNESASLGGAGFLSPGTVPLVKNSDGPTPFIGYVSRSSQYPAANSPFKITCAAGAVTAPTVTLYYFDGSSTTTEVMVYNGTTQLYEAEIGGFPDGTHLRYYIEATDGSKTGRAPLTAAQTDLRFPYFGDFYYVDVADNVVDGTDVLINEILYNPDGLPNGGRQWVELYNNTANTIDVSGYIFTDSTGQFENCRIPDGAVIPANDFIILASTKANFVADYSTSFTLDMSKVFDLVAMHSGGAPFFNTGGNSPTISHSNAYHWLNQPTIPYQTVAYTNAAPWPVTGGDPDGPTIELLAPNLDPTVGANWALSTQPIGSPLAPNQQSAISDWSIY